MYSDGMQQRRATGAARLLAPILILAVLIVAAAPSSSSAAPSHRCGYIEGGEYTGLDNNRIVAFNRRVSCDHAITVIRSFRGFLPKHRHGSGDLATTWWTLPSLPGWRCRKNTFGGSCASGAATAAFVVQSIGGPVRCSNQITLGPGGILILSWSHVGCRLRRRVARRSGASQQRHMKDYGFRCHLLPLRAGGGGAICRRGIRFVEVGYE